MPDAAKLYNEGNLDSMSGIELDKEKFRKIRVAIDGPSGAGKSTIAKAVAKKAGFIYADTGALYRTVGLYAMENGVDKYDAAGIVALLDKIDVKLEYRDGRQTVLLCGNDVGEKIRTEEASAYASAVSKIPEVRAYLLGIQKKLAYNGGVVMDGRDIGTVIIPDAEVKIFMEASPETRAKRRYDEQAAKGLEVSYEGVLESIIARDKQDSEREIAPLKPAEDAVRLENDNRTVDESAEFVLSLMREAAEVMV